MTTIEQPAPSAVLAGDLRELIPFLPRAGQAREVVRRAAVLIEAMGNRGLGWEGDGWEPPTVRLARRRFRRGTR